MRRRRLTAADSMLDSKPQLMLKTLPDLSMHCVGHPGRQIKMAMSEGQAGGG